ncbi:hypothetical protein DQ04_14621000, partial [Trypanosoma grayi]|uniref:hypothetical protein n=1 Tax=Trypanosoma grayi TaxID=71804 RepID=UPI0004F409ED
AAAAAREMLSSTTAVRLQDGAAAPWVAVRLQQRVCHLAVVSNARVVEVHVGDAPIQTHEAAVAVGDWFLHDGECDAAAGQTLKLKFFARRPKAAVDVAAVLLACVAPDPAGLSEGNSNDHSGS